VKEGACPSRETGCEGQRPQVEACSMYVRQKRRCVGVRKVSHGMVDGPPRPTINPPRLQTYLTPRQHMADSAECWQNTISEVSPYHQGKSTYILQPSTWTLCSPQACFYTQTRTLLHIGSDYFRVTPFPV